MKPETEAACEFALNALERANALLDEEAQASIAEQSPPDLVRFYADLREQADRLRDSVATMSKLENNISFVKIPEVFDAAGVQNVKVTGYGLVTIKRKWSCSMLNKEQGLQYLRDAGQGGMIIETVPAPTLGAWARKETEDQGREPPDDVFKTTIARFCSLTRSR